ncbi:MAG: HAMP domain-containing sensor histidine kinase [Paludibacter sp.]|nr:HAMP domain-containing sensor histidine kinase [Paludibacter sp.]
MTYHRITIIAILSLFIIFFSQGYLVYDYYSTTRDGLVRESDAILNEAFKKDLELRRAKFKVLTGADTIKTIPVPTKANTMKIDLSMMDQYKGNLAGMMEMVMNISTSAKVPMKLQALDSVTTGILRDRNIQSEFCIVLLDAKTDSVLQMSASKAGKGIFNIRSQNLVIDVYQGRALQLILLNPFGLILQRMALMLITSLVFSVICVLAFVYLQRILARQKQLVAFKNEFLGTIAHELKRPVASLVFNLDCLSQSAQVASGGQNAMLLQSSLRATEEMNDSISMIVNLTKLEEGMLELRHEQIGLMQMLEELKDRFTSISPKKPDISISCEPQLKTLWGDRQLLMQCFANLIDNAIKYSGDEVRIQISVRREDNRVLVSVRDNGFGIPADKLVFLFDKYSRLHTDATKVNGFGIGLNYVKNIVEKHRGEVRVASEPGQGSEFCVLLPQG